MNRHSITAAAALLLLPLAGSGSLAHAATDDRSGPSVTRIITLDSAPAAQRSSSKDRAAARHAVDDSQRVLVDVARHAGIPLTVHRHYRNVVNGLVVKVPAAQADRLTALPGVASVSKPVVYEAPEKPTPVSEDALKKAVAQAGGTSRSAAGAPSGREVVTTTDLTGVPQAHRQGYTGKGVTVGIVDSGIAYDHPALGGGGFANAKVVGGYDFADEDTDPYDDRYGPAAGHGTQVAGIVAGDDAHIVGAAPDATLRSYRVFGTKNAATDDIIIAALDRAAADGVNVVNMSLGAEGERSSSVLSLAVDNLGLRHSHRRRRRQRLRGSVQRRGPGCRGRCDSRGQHLQQPLPVPGLHPRRRLHHPRPVPGLRARPGRARDRQQPDHPHGLKLRSAARRQPRRTDRPHRPGHRPGGGLQLPPAGPGPHSGGRRGGRRDLPRAADRPGHHPRVAVLRHHRHPAGGNPRERRQAHPRRAGWDQAHLGRLRGQPAERRRRRTDGPGLLLGPRQ
ncbi:S8 family serine peptidase [Streptomyces sp. NPDC001020]